MKLAELTLLTQPLTRELNIIIYNRFCALRNLQRFSLVFFSNKHRIPLNRQLVH